MRAMMLHSIALAVLASALPAYAEKAETSSLILQSNSNIEASAQIHLPGLSDIPIMQEQGKRMATLMKRIQEIKDPAERKRLLAEAVCPQ